MPVQASLASRCWPQLHGAGSTSAGRDPVHAFTGYPQAGHRRWPAPELLIRIFERRAGADRCGHSAFRLYFLAAFFCMSLPVHRAVGVLDLGRPGARGVFLPLRKAFIAWPADASCCRGWAWGGRVFAERDLQRGTAGWPACSPCISRSTGAAWAGRPGAISQQEIPPSPGLRHAAPPAGVFSVSAHKDDRKEGVPMTDRHSSGGPHQPGHTTLTGAGSRPEEPGGRGDDPDRPPAQALPAGDHNALSEEHRSTGCCGWR